MPSRDRRVDAYIAQAPAFAQPILNRVRDAVHAGCPDVEETMKWSVPHFDYQGPICGMAAFKQHVRFGFWKAPLLTGQGLGAVPGMATSRLTAVTGLPAQPALIKMVKAAAALNAQGVKMARPVARKPPIRVPAFLAAALKKDRRAAAAFERFPPSHKREYIEWLTEAKAEATRERRLVQALTWMAEGKSRNWKYER
jgi:hypothetical protein